MFPSMKISREVRVREKAKLGEKKIETRQSRVDPHQKAAVAGFAEPKKISREWRGVFPLQNLHFVSSSSPPCFSLPHSLSQMILSTLLHAGCYYRNRDTMVYPEVSFCLDALIHVISA